MELGYARTELRRQLVDAVLRGEKTATAGLPEPGESHGNEGDRCLLLGFDDEPVGAVELTEVRVLPAGEIDVQFARDEGEGFETVEDWRVAHERFLERPIHDDTEAGAVRFPLVDRFRRPGSTSPHRPTCWCSDRCCRFSGHGATRSRSPPATTVRRCSCWSCTASRPTCSAATAGALRSARHARSPRGSATSTAGGVAAASTTRSRTVRTS